MAIARSYFAYHHVVRALAGRVDHVTLFANLFLLATVTIILFPTRLLATFLAMAIAFAVPLASELRGMSRQRLDWLPTISGALVPPSGAPEVPST
ncbi:hypothetical protein KDK95_21265 [Actinospica sp. MGRD01-02]|uniref:Uncharacterized protein n=1 Tax=Actinospica acidithermotolerans TaxID=2828514 RepID=A0A941ILA3_9ACTN|nr:hypothetical protein [Actinospica acidithermotolerans]MBR7828853.1 hypothetical protein [Actinospica acidithermotolerans]